MKRNLNLYKFVPAILLGMLSLWLLAPELMDLLFEPTMGETTSGQPAPGNLKKQLASYPNLTVELADPKQAPVEIRDLVLSGQKIMLETSKYAKKYVGASSYLTCNNCHFSAGNTVGGKNGGISLAGVAAKYPRYDKDVKAVVDLPTRINYCFEKSMNGHPLPLNSREMLALVTYMHYISSNVPIYSNLSWLGLKPLTNTHQPNIKNGETVYTNRCQICHELNGEGIHIPNKELESLPPVWGSHSFNTHAGMNSQQTMEAFIYENMPYREADLSAEDARDVAAYIISKPHPR